MPPLQLPGEECYIHEKYRQAGRKTICLPFLKWVHRFDRAEKVKYPLSDSSKVKNYLLEFLELGLDFTSVKDVVQANLLSCTSNKVGKGEIINIGNGSNKSVQDIADIFGGPFEYKPKRLEPFQTLADNTRALELLEWTPTGNVEEWLKKYVL